MKEKKVQFNFCVSAADKKLVDRLRSEYAINISGAFHLFLKEMLRKQDILKDMETL